MHKTATMLRRLKRDMKDFLVLFGQTSVILFVLWHMAAVLAFSIPTVQGDPVSAYVRDTLRPTVAPYLLLTSQWQQWDLFAPDPLRAVTTFAIDREDGARWKEVFEIEPGTFPWWRHATYAKLLPALLDKERNDFDVFRERFLQMMCADLDLPEGALVRMRENKYVIPYLEAHASADWWKQWKPVPESTVIRMTNCHPSSVL